MCSNKLIFGAYNPYYGLPQRTHHIARHLSKSLKLVWIDPPSLAALSNFCPPKPSEHFHPSILSFLSYSDPVSIRPLALPHYCRLDFAWLQTEKIINSVIRTVVQDSDILIISHPIFCSGAIAAKDSGARVVYDVLDFYPGFQFFCKTALIRDQQLVRASDLVTVVSFGLQRMFESKTAKCIRIPNGVRSDFIARNIPESDRIHTQPTIGYIGSFGRWVDLDLVLRIAKKKPYWRFLLAGEITKSSRFVRKAPPNCNFIGKLLHDDVPRFIDKLDVALIPFKINQLTQCAFPIKLLEYFARGKPVVSSYLNEIVEVARDLAYIANSEEEWVYAIENALNEKRELKACRIELAKNYIWEKIAKTYQDHLVSLLT